MHPSESRSRRRGKMRARTLAVLMLAGLSLTAALREPFEFIVAPSSENNRRNSEADMLRLRDGRLLLAWIDFYGPAGSDWAPSRISGMYSRDQGRTWGCKFTLQENIVKM